VQEGSVYKHLYNEKEFAFRNGCGSQTLSI